MTIDKKNFKKISTPKTLSPLAYKKSLLKKRFYKKCFQKNLLNGTNFKT